MSHIPAIYVLFWTLRGGIVM